ncbi:hypothetical protein GRZ55_03895 [Chelativorans sp. ZYF759]|uniref:HNH endonuclease n=1 Tax=Chelativorans sp. ZYF759 TaxID=2692213 RepID=UPI00145D50B4|nr:hypothetical protein [Chelativorans sp. ZYF759]
MKDALPAQYNAMDVYRHLVSTGVAADLALPNFGRLSSTTNRRLRTGHRAGWACSECNAPCDIDQGTIDHHVPRSRNGSNRPANLRWMCKPCNLRKADKMPATEVVSTCFKTPTPVVVLQRKPVVKPYGDLFEWL